MNTLFAWPIRIYYEDTDGGGVVYHSRYLNFLERARTEWLRSLGVEQEAFCRETGLRFAVADMTLRFLAPARMDEQLTATVGLGRLGGASLAMNQQLLRQETPLVLATVRIACIDPRFKPAAMPSWLVERIRQGQAEAGK